MPTAPEDSWDALLAVASEDDEENLEPVMRGTLRTININTKEISRMSKEGERWTRELLRLKGQRGR